MFRRRARGFSLLEIIVALTIILLGLFAVTFIVLNSMQLVTSNQQSSLALCGAREMIEQVRSTAFSVVYATFNGKNFAVNGLTAQPSDTDGLPGKATVSNADPKKLVVTVEVKWNEEGRNRSLTLYTEMVDRYPPTP